MVSQQIALSKGLEEDNSLAQIIRTLESEIEAKGSELQANSPLSISKLGDSSFEALSDISGFDQICSFIKSEQVNTETAEDSNKYKGFCSLCSRERSSVMKLRAKKLGLWSTVEYLFSTVWCCTDHTRINKFQELVSTCSKCGTVLTKSTIR